MVRKKKKRASAGLALIPVLFLILFLMIAVLPIETMAGLPDISVDARLPLFFGAMFAALISIVFLGYSWGELEDRMIETIKMSMGAVLILLVIGMLIGTWVISGIVPAMIYYGFNILSPSFFLVATLIICSLVSLATGSSWGTAGTVGVALMGIGTGLGVDPAICGGAIISGAYFGDKMSPLSDTTNLAAAMAGAKLFDHVKHMVFTTGPSYLISLVLFGLIGMEYGSRNLDPTQVLAIQDGLAAVFPSMTPLLVLVPVLVIVLVMLKMPPIPALFLGALAGGGCAMVFQGTDINAMLNSFLTGYASNTGNAVIDELLTRGGMDAMLWTVSLILCAMCFGGVMEKSGMLGAIAEAILKIAKGTGGLVIATVFSCIFMNFLSGDQYLSIVIPGRMYKRAYDQAGLAPRNLSRALEDAGTLTSPLIPWNTCGATMIGALGLVPWTYVPYCFLNIINPVISILYGIFGITMLKVAKDPTLIKVPETPAAKSAPATVPEVPVQPAAKVEAAPADAVVPEVKPEPAPKVEAIPMMDIQPDMIPDLEEEPVVVAHTATRLQVKVAGKELDIKETPVILADGVTEMLPAALVAEAMGYLTNYDSSSQALTLQKDNETISITGGALAHARGAATHYFSVAPVVYQGALYVPFDFVTSNPAFALKRNGNLLEIEAVDPSAPKVITAKVIDTVPFANGIGVKVEESPGNMVMLYLTERTAIFWMHSGEVADRTAIKQGVKAQFTYSVVPGKDQKLYSVVRSIELMNE